MGDGIPSEVMNEQDNGAELVIERFLNIIDRMNILYIVEENDTDYPWISIESSEDTLAIITRSHKTPQISFLGCPDAYNLFTEFSFVHPPLNGYDDRWYTVDILPTTNLSFLYCALNSAYAACGSACGCFSSEYFKRLSYKNTADLARMLRENDYFNVEYFYDSRIPRNSNKFEQKVLPYIVEIRRLMHSKEVNSLSPGARFRKAAKIAEDLEDDYYVDTFSIPPVSYESNLNSLRGYFSWRTKYRKESLKDVPDCFAQLYASELINGVGWSDPVDGQKMLFQAYLDLHSTLHDVRYWRWVLDFTAYYNLTPIWDFNYTDEMECLVEIFEQGTIGKDRMIPFLKSHTNFKFDTKKSFLEYHNECIEVLALFVHILYSRYQSDPDSKLLFEWHSNSWYELFCGIPFEVGEEHGKYTCLIDPVNKYEFDGDKCTFSKCTLSSIFIISLPDILSTLDVMMKKELSKSRAKEALSPENEYYQCLQKAIHSWKIKKNKRVVVIDGSKLDSVRQDAQEISQKIMTSEEINDEPEVHITVVPKPVEEEVSSDTGSVLDETELEFMKLLISGGDCIGFLRKKHKMLSLIIESVNEKLYDTYNDVVIEMSGDDPVIVEDYKDEIRKIICP